MKTILTILFLLLSAVVFSMDKKTQEYLLETYKTPYNLAYGIEKPKPIKWTDFTLLPTKSHTISNNSEAFIPFTYDTFVNWYKTDFAAEPFDGRIEVLVVGEPLPSVPLTLFISTLLLFTYLKYRKLHTIQEIS